MIMVYEYIGDNVLTLPSAGKWIKLKHGDNVIVSKHIVCKGCNKCPGMAVVLDPPLYDPICFIPGKNDFKFPLIKLHELSSLKKETKHPGRLIRPISDNEEVI